MDKFKLLYKRKHQFIEDQYTMHNAVHPSVIKDQQQHTIPYVGYDQYSVHNDQRKERNDCQRRRLTAMIVAGLIVFVVIHNS